MRGYAPARNLLLDLRQGERAPWAFSQTDRADHLEPSLGPRPDNADQVSADNILGDKKFATGGFVSGAR